MAKLNLKQSIKGWDGEPIVDEKGNSISLGDVIRVAMSAQSQDDSAKLKSTKFQIGVKSISDENEFTVEELSAIKKSVADIYNALIYGRVEEIIENATPNTEE